MITVRFGLLTKRELSEDPRDLLARLLSHRAMSFGHDRQMFVADYLLFARCHASRRPLAPDGKCEPCLSRRGPQVDASIRSVVGAATINPKLLTAAERIQYEGYLRREEDNAAILRLAKDGIAIKEIVRRTGYSRCLVRRILRGQRSDIFRVRESSLELYLP